LSAGLLLNLSEAKRLIETRRGSQRATRPTRPRSLHENAYEQALGQGASPSKACTAALMSWKFTVVLPPQRKMSASSNVMVV